MRSSILSQRKTHTSKIVEGSVVNTQHFITNNSKKKRTVYHTPAIIETVVEEDQLPPPSPVVIQRPIVQNVALPPARRISSLPIPAPRPITIQPIQRVQPISIIHNRASQIVQRAPSVAPTSRSLYDSRGFGVKVKQDLSSIRPPTIYQEDAGCCHRSYVSLISCCRFFKCPFWICCLIPLLIVLVLIGCGIWRNPHINIANTRKNQYEKIAHRNKNTKTQQFVDPIVQSPASNNNLDLNSDSQNKQQIVKPIQDTRNNGLVYTNTNTGNNKNRVLSRVVKVQEKIQKVIDDSEDTQNLQNKNSQTKKQQQSDKVQGQNKESEKNQTENKQPEDNKQQPKTQSQTKTQSSSQQNLETSTSNNKPSRDSSSSSSTTVQQTTTTNRNKRRSKRSSTEINQSPISSIFNSIINFRLAPTFKQNWKPKPINETHHHLKRLI